MIATANDHHHKSHAEKYPNIAYRKFGHKIFFYDNRKSSIAKLDPIATADVVGSMYHLRGTSVKYHLIHPLIAYVDEHYLK